MKIVLLKEQLPPFFIRNQNQPVVTLNLAYYSFISNGPDLPKDAQSKLNHATRSKSKRDSVLAHTLHLRCMKNKKAPPGFSFLSLCLQLF